jgi:hypothetical protein
VSGEGLESGEAINPLRRGDQIRTGVSAPAFSYAGSSRRFEQDRESKPGLTVSR